MAGVKTMGGNNPGRSFDVLTRKWALWVILSATPVFVLFVYLGGVGKGLAAYLAFSIIAVAVRYFWDLKNRIWFWVTIALVAIAHLSLIIFVSSPERDYNKIQLLPICLLDFGIVWGIIKLAENALGKKQER